MRARTVLARLARLDGRRRALIAWACGWILISKAALVVPGGSLAKWQRWLDRLAGGLPAAPPCTPREAAWAITAAARRVPRTQCLAWSLALRGLLTQAGIASELRIGVAAARPGTITAHAWIDVAGDSWSWGDVDGYSVLRPRAAGP
jgi:hypothetical protein